MVTRLRPTELLTRRRSRILMPMGLANSSESQVIQMPQAPGKTQQRVRNLREFMQTSTSHPHSYEELRTASGMPYDALLYVLSAWDEMGVVEKLEIAEGAGRPKVYFKWVGMLGSSSQSKHAIAS